MARLEQYLVKARAAEDNAIRCVDELERTVADFEASKEDSSG